MVTFPHLQIDKLRGVVGWGIVAAGALAATISLSVSSPPLVAPKV